MWILIAFLSSLFAGITSILVKLGVKTTDSDVATAIRTTVVLAFAWVMVWITGCAEQILNLTLPQILWLAASGVATGVSWICYFKALSLADVNKVAPIDKSSVILTVLFSITVLKEYTLWWVQLICVALIGLGTLLMIERKAVDGKSAKGGYLWLVLAIISAVAASLTSIFAKIGMQGVNSTLATALRTCVVLVIAWAIVLFRGKAKKLRGINVKELAFILLSGVATGASWLCFYSAMQQGLVGVVNCIDKLSILITVVFSRIVLKEKLSRRALVGLILIVSATLAMALAVYFVT
ncbi:MAG: EamA family transporter [Candidatus Coproplasma sp.]